MDKVKKKKLRRAIAAVCVVALVVLLAAMPLLAKQTPQEDGPQASILSGSVSTGAINTALIGGGALAEEDASVISVPAAVKLTKFLVANGDAVTEGTPIASVDRITVMTAISQIQETLEYLSEQIELAGQTDADETVRALAGGTVKILYAKEGETAQNTMLAHGSLAVLSLDGLMAVDLQTESDISVGSQVTLTLPGGTTVTGKVVTNLAGNMTVTVEDDGYAVGTAVQVAAPTGASLGSGQLYIYSPWNATAYAGTIDNIHIAEGDKLDAGDKLLTLSDVGYSAAYRQLVSQRQEYEEMMLDLFKMYQTQTLTAPCDGVVSGIDKDSAQLLSASQQTYVLNFLANAPNGNDETAYTNYVGKVDSLDDTGWLLGVNPAPLSITDYKDLSGVPTDPTAMTQQVPFSPNVPIYSLSGDEWVQVDATSIRIGDILLFALDESGVCVWAVKITPAPAPGPGPSDPTEPTDPTDPTDPTGPTDPTDPSIPAGPSDGQYWGGFPPIEQEPEFELYELDVVDVAAVTPQTTMTLDITIDELDITSLALGMTAQIRIDALGGEKHTATITEIGNTGENNGGSSKFTVELTIERKENMLVGMTAIATLVLDTTEDVLTLPARALVEKGTQTLVYTGYDAEKGILLDLVEVTVGISDGETVEILSGLSYGQTYYYPYYDTLEISYTPDFGNGFSFG